jgi:glycosyltransferase involved in cell wall biosynthesis
MPKVLLFIPNLQQGGAERQILELMTRLPPRFEPVLCVYHENDHYRGYLPPGQPRHVLGVRDMGPAGLRKLVKVLDDEQPHILHSYRDKANFWARLAALLARTRPPVVLSSCRTRSMNVKFVLAEPFLSRVVSDRVLTNSEGVKRELVSYARVPEDKVRIIHNFVNLGRFRPPSDEERRAARVRFGVTEGEIALLLPGRVSRQKNQLGLGLALGLLRRRGALPPNVKILLAGRDRDRVYAAVVPRWLSALKVDANVRNMGTVADADMPSLYHAADALLLPSLFEGLPNAVIEAHASGLPAIVSAAANYDGLVLRDESGFEVPTGSVRPLADAIARMVALDDGARRRMGSRGREHIATQFHPDRVLAEMVGLYDELLSAKGVA